MLHIPYKWARKFKVQHFSCIKYFNPPFNTLTVKDVFFFLYKKLFLKIIDSWSVWPSKEFILGWHPSDNVRAHNTWK